jgi:hypothetical protein
MNKIWTSRRDRAGLPYDFDPPMLCDFRTSGLRQPRHSLFPAAGLRDILTPALPNSVTP